MTLGKASKKNSEKRLPLWFLLLLTIKVELVSFVWNCIFVANKGWGVSMMADSSHVVWKLGRFLCTWWTWRKQAKPAWPSPLHPQGGQGGGGSDSQSEVEPFNNNHFNEYVPWSWSWILECPKKMKIELNPLYHLCPWVMWAPKISTKFQSLTDSLTDPLTGWQG